MAKYFNLSFFLRIILDASFDLNSREFAENIFTILVHAFLVCIWALMILVILGSALSLSLSLSLSRSIHPRSTALAMHGITII